MCLNQDFFEFAKNAFNFSSSSDSRSFCYFAVHAKGDIFKWKTKTIDCEMSAKTVCVCVLECERESVCVCACVWERDRPWILSYIPSLAFSPAFVCSLFLHLCLHFVSVFFFLGLSEIKHFLCTFSTFLLPAMH